MSGREILRALRERRDFFAETPGHDETGRGWYIGGNMLDERDREYSVGAGISVGPLSLDVSICTCGEWHAHAYLSLPAPAGERRRVWATLWCDEWPRWGHERFIAPQAQAINDRFTA